MSDKKTVTQGARFLGWLISRNLKPGRRIQIVDTGEIGRIEKVETDATGDNDPVYLVKLDGGGWASCPCEQARPIN